MAANTELANPNPRCSKPDPHLRRYAVIALILSCVLTVIVVVQGISILNMLNRLDEVKQISCNFYGQIATIPTSFTNNGIPVDDLQDKVFVKIIDDARQTYEARGCGKL